MDEIPCWLHSSWYSNRVSALRILPALLFALSSCTLLFGSSNAEPDAADIPYSLRPVWQTNTGATGQIDVGPDGILAFAGHFNNSVLVDGKSFSSSGGLDLLLLQLDPKTGKLLLAQQFGTRADEFVTSLSVSDNNNLMVAGAVDGDDANVGGNSIDSTSPSNTGFFARYDQALAHTWSLFIESSVSNSTVSGISADGAPVYICGSYKGTLTLTDTQSETKTLPEATKLEGYYGKYNENGRFSGNGQIAFTGLGHERCTVVVDDNLLSAYIAGFYTETIDFSATLNSDPDAGLPPAPATTNYFVGRINHNTSMQWVLSIPGNTRQFPTMHGAKGKDNQLVLVTEMKGDVLVPDLNTTLSASFNDGDVAFFIIAPADGEILVARSFPSLGPDRASDVAVSPDGEIAIVGTFTGAIDFGGGELQSKGQVDSFVALFNAQGQHLWSQSYGTSGEDQATSVAFDSDGALYLSFQHQNGIDFGLGPVAGMNTGTVVKFEAVGSP